MAEKSNQLRQYWLFLSLICLLMLLIGFIGSFRFFPNFLTTAKAWVAQTLTVDTQIAYALDSAAGYLPSQFLADSKIISQNSTDSPVKIWLLHDMAAFLPVQGWDSSSKIARQECEGSAGVLPDLPQEPQATGKIPPPPPDKKTAASKAVQVAIYSTHSAETYIPYAGVAKSTGKRGGVYKASAKVAESLAGYGINTIVSQNIHDYPDWNLSYKNSLKTASGLLAKNPSTKILIDMHRDAGVPKDACTVKIKGKPAARIMLVVGTAERLDHPNWRKNLAFAQKIAATMDAMYPGLLRKVSEQNGRYNQHTSPHAILVEMGCEKNTMAEVEYSAQMLAAVLAKVLSTP